MDEHSVQESTTTDDGYAIVVADHEDEEDRRSVENGLIAFNATVSPFFSAEVRAASPARALDVFVRGADGRILGGVTAQTGWDWLSIELVWLDESLRGRGLGTRLMRTSEDEARRRGCKRAHLTTYSFQARGFYERLGYRVVGQLDDFPPGSTRYWLRKDFADDASLD